MLRHQLRAQLLPLFIGLFIGIGSPHQADGLTWKMPPDVFDPSINAISTDVAADPAGNAFSMWTNQDEVLYSQFLASTGVYGPPQLLYTGNNPMREVQVAMDATQTAVSVYVDATLGELRSSYFDGTVWTNIATPIATVPVDPTFTFPVLDMDGSGNAVVVWWDQNVTPGIFASEFDGNTATWSAPTLLSGPNLGNFPRVQYSENGTAVATWRDDANNIVASVFNGTSWTTPPPIIIAANGTNPEVGMDAAGNSLIVWEDLTTNELMSSFNLAAPVTIPSGPISFSSFSFAMSQDGTAVVLWRDGANNINYSNFIGGVWSGPLPLTNSTDFFTVTMDRLGNALAIINSTSSYKPSSGVFGPLDPVGIEPLDVVGGFGIALADNGRGFVTTLFDNDEGRGAYGTYTLLTIPPPVIFGRVCDNKFASQTDHVHIITWLPSPDANVVAYYLRRDGVLIAIIPASGPFIYVDHNRPKRIPEVYSLTAVNNLGQESVPSIIVLK